MHPLSQVEIVRRIYEAFNRRDLAAVKGLLHPEFEVNLSRSAGFDRDNYVGEPALERFAGSYWDTFASIQIEIEEVHGPGEEGLVAIVRARAEGSGSGAEVDARGPHVWRFRDGGPVALALYEHLDEALAAAGIRADEAAGSTVRDPAEGRRAGGEDHEPGVVG